VVFSFDCTEARISSVEHGSVLQVHLAFFPNTGRTAAMSHSRTDTVSLAGRDSQLEAGASLSGWRRPNTVPGVHRLEEGTAMRPRALVIALAFVVGSAMAPAVPAGAAGAHRAPAPARRGVADFNGDGLADLAIGADQEKVGTATQAGAVHVLNGSPDGLTATGSVRLTENTASVPGTAEDGDSFGGALATGDFDDDGFSDLAVGVPGQDGSFFDVGAIDVLYGSATGLSGTGSQRFAEDDVGAVAGDQDRFGAALIAGDFDGDGVDDLAIGIPNKEVSGEPLAGAVGVLYGEPDTGLSSGSSQLITEDELPAGQAGQDALFGSALVAADFGMGAEDDLVVGAPFDLDGSVSAGSASIVYGGATGLDTSTGTIFVSSAFSGSHPGPTSSFGSTLAWGRLAGSDLPDIVVGAAGEKESKRRGAGAVYLLLGRAAGVSAVGARRITEADAGVPSTPLRDEFFGTALAVGNFGGTGDQDLAVDASGEWVGGLEAAGAVFVIPGSGSGPATSRTKRFTLDTPGIPGHVEDDGLFGERSLSAGNFGRGGRADLAVASYLETVSGIHFAGAVRALYGTPTGLTGKGTQRWTAASKGVAGSPGPTYFFGDSLA
jgi:hypothetical protein